MNGEEEEEPEELPEEPEEEVVEEVVEKSMLDLSPMNQTRPLNEEFISGNTNPF